METEIGPRDDVCDVFRFNSETFSEKLSRPNDRALFFSETRTKMSPASLTFNHGKRAMERHLFKQIKPFEKHLAEEAERLRTEAKLLPLGPQRDQLLRKARQAETGSRITGWLTSPGLRPPN